MKKQIVVLVASALLTQITFAQEMSNIITPVGEEKTQVITIGAGAILAANDWDNLNGVSISTLWTDTN